MRVLAIDEILPGPYPSPKVPALALSDAMRMERVCRDNGFLSISAPQLGISSSLFVYWKNYPSEPKIFSYVSDCEYEGIGDLFLSLESCPSMPGRTFSTKRHLEVRATGHLISESPDGKIKLSKFDEVLSGLEAAIFQHEVDHIRGVSIDKIGEKVGVR